MKSMLRPLSLAILTACLATPALAQSLVGSVEGTVKDEQGGVLPGVTVTLSGRMGSRTSLTDGAGVFRFLAVEPGPYGVSSSLSGFATLTRGQLSVSAGRRVTVDFTLTVQSRQEAVNVVAEAPLVDTKSAAQSNALSQEQLFNLPIRPSNAATDLLNLAPGVNNGSAFGGSADAANALMLDGVDTRDPENGTAWAFYNYNMIEEVQVQGLGAPAEYGAFSGAVINTITKSGGNRHTALFDVVYAADGFSSNNISEKIKTANPALADPAKTNKLLDYTAQFGGPIKADKLFFFVSAQRYNIRQDPTGPRTVREEWSPRFNAKLTWQPSSADSFMATFQYDSYSIKGRAGVPDLVATDVLTNRESSPEAIWGAHWRHVFGPKTFLEVKWTGYGAYYDLNPEVNTPGRIDLGTGGYSVSQGWYYWADRDRQQVNASVSHYAEAYGQHSFKFGVEVERSKLRSRYGYVDGILYADLYGAPYLAYSYGYDVNGKSQRESVYAQDAWRIGNRLTVTPGLRADMLRGYDDALGTKVYSNTTWAPRLGFAFDATGDGTTVVRGHYGQFYEGIFFSAYSRATTGIEDYVTFENDGQSLVEVDRSPTMLYRMDPKTRHPRVDQWTLGAERSFARNWKASATGIYRTSKNFIDSVLPSARWDPVAVPNELGGGNLTVYDWANRSDSEEDLLLTNPDGLAYLGESGEVLGVARASRKYRGLMLVLGRRQANRWQGQISYVLSQTDGTVNNGSSGTFGGNRNFETPTLSLVNSEGEMTYSPRHEIKVLGGYTIPKVELAVSLYYRYVNGINYAAYQRYFSDEISFPYRAGREPFLEPRGSRRVGTENVLDLRLEKVFTLSGDRGKLAFYGDITNVFNAGTVLSEQERYPYVSIDGAGDVAFGAPSAVIAPRELKLGARWSF